MDSMKSGAMSGGDGVWVRSGDGRGGGEVGFLVSEVHEVG